MVHTEYIDLPTLERLEKLVEDWAKRAEDTAGYSGAMNDGGARAMRESFSMYKQGFNKILPVKYKALLEEDAKHRDPEYQEYLRLKKKFE